METKLEEEIDALGDLVFHLENRMMPFLDSPDIDPDAEVEAVSAARNSLEKWIEIQSSKVNNIKARVARIDHSLIIPAPIQKLHELENEPHTKES